MQPLRTQCPVAVEWCSKLQQSTLHGNRHGFSWVVCWPVQHDQASYSITLSHICLQNGVLITMVLTGQHINILTRLTLFSLETFKKHFPDFRIFWKIADIIINFKGCYYSVQIRISCQRKLKEVDFAYNYLFNYK